MRSTFKLLVGAIATLGLVLAAATPASAADGWQRTVDVYDGDYANGRAKVCAYAGETILYAEGCFQPYGDWFWLRDNYENRIPVGIDWSFTYGSTHRSGVAYWDGTRAADWTNLNKNFNEGGTLRFRVCEVYVPSQIVSSGTCGNYVTTRT